jgi:hypothetical protein
MSHLAFYCRKSFALAFLLICSFSLAGAQEERSVRNSAGAMPGSPLYTPADSASLGTSSPVAILAQFVAAETKGREALNQHTFKRDVTLQTIGPNGEVTGEYIRNSQFLFDDQGQRIERVLFHPPSRIHEMRITKEDIQDLAGAQLLGIDIVEATSYLLTYVGPETVDSRQLIAIDVAPLAKPDPKHMQVRFFVGRVWIDPISFQIVKVRGVVEPRGKQRFPVFETWREAVNGTFPFPSRTVADDVLRFPEGDIHYRINVRYYDYKLFGSKVTIKDVDDVANIEATRAPIPTKPAAKREECVTNRNAPPVSSYHWGPDSAVKVYLVRNMFTVEQRAALLETLRSWTSAGNEANAGITFTYAGETDSLVNCRSCLTLTRREVYKNDGSHYSFFNPLSSEQGRILLSAWIDLDFATTSPRAVQGFVAHELGHGMGLWDCETCKSKRTLMSGFPDINKDNGLIAPSTCDVETLKTVYARERQIAASTNLSNGVQLAAGTNSAAARLSVAGAPAVPEKLH